MTLPNDSPGYWFQLLYDKLVGIEQKIDGHAEKLAKHEIRLNNVEDEIGELKSTRSDEKKSTSGWRQVTLTIVVSAVVSVIGVLIPILIR